MNLFDLFFRIGAKDEASGVLGKITAGFKGFAKMAGVAIGAAVTGMGAFAASSVKTGQEFDKSMSQVAATMGFTVEQLNAGEDALASMTESEREAALAAQQEFGTLRDFAQEMGRTTVFSATQASEALNYMALAGYDAAKSQEMLPTVLNLAASGNMELARASDMVTDAESALGLKTEETAAMVDQMAKTASKSNTSVEQLGEAILTIGGTAQFMAGGTERLNTVLGILADNGIKGSEAGTHLRNMLLKLSAPTAEGKKTIEALGLEIFDASGNMRDMQDIITDLGDAMSDMTDEQKIQTISDLFNARDITAVNALLNTSTQRWNELGAAIEDSTGAAQAMAETQLDNLAGDITLFQSALEGAKIAISDVLTPTIREFVQFGTDGISRLTEAFKEDGLSGAMGVFGEILSEGVQMIVKMLPEIVDGAVDLVMAFANGLIDNVDVILDAFAQIVTLLVGKAKENLPQLITAFLEAFSGIVEAIGGIIPELASAFVEIVPQIADTLAQEIPTMIDAFVTLILAVLDAIPVVIPVIVEQIPKIVEAVVNGLLSALPKLIEGAIKFFMAIVKAIPVLIKEIVPKIPEIVTTIINALLENLPALLDGAVTLFMAIVDAIPEILTALLEALPQIIETVIGGLMEAFPQLLDAAITVFMAIVDSIPVIIDALIENLPQIIDTIITTLVENMPMLLQGAITFFMAIIKALPTIIRALVVNLPKLINTIINTLLDNLPLIIQASIDLFMGIVEAIPQIIVELVKNLPEIITAIVEGLGEGFSSMIEVGGRLLDGLWQGIKDGASGLWKKVKGWAEGLVKDIKGLFGIHSPSKLFREEIGKMLPKGLEEGFSDEMPKVEMRINKSLEGLGDFNAVVKPIKNSNTLTSGYDSGYNENKPINLYIDKDKLVASTSREMDRNLGSVQKLKARFGGATA